MYHNTHHLIEIPNKGIRKYIPKELAHCNNDEFKDVAKLLLDWQSGKINYDEFKSLSIYRLLNLKKGTRKLNNIDLENTFSNIAMVSNVMESFFYDNQSQNKRIKLNIVENPVPRIKPIFTSIKGPKARLVDTTFGQYEDASHEYQMYYSTTNQKYLWNLFAIYYQNPKNYNIAKAKKNVAFFKKYIDPALVYAFFLFFEAFQNYVTSSKVVVEAKTIDLSILFSSNKEAEKSSLPGLGTKSLAFLISNIGIMGNLEQTRKQPLWDVFLLLYDIRKNEIDAEAAAKKDES